MMKYKIKKVSNIEEFVGVVIENNEVVLHIPSVFRKDSSQDIINFLSSLSIGKEHEVEISAYNNTEKGKFSPFASYLFILEDYVDNGIYMPRELVHETNGSGQINWSRTLENAPIYNNGSFVYVDYVTDRFKYNYSLISYIYAECVHRTIDLFGWIYGLDQINIEHSLSKTEMIDILQWEIENTFDDSKIKRFEHMLSVLTDVQADEKESTGRYTYGVYNYSYIFERMIDSMFGNVNKLQLKKYFPKGIWRVSNAMNSYGNKYFNSDQYKTIDASILMPDTVYEMEDKVFIIDSKFYRFGGGERTKTGLPDTSSIQKQITYAQHALKKTAKTIYNVFIIPFDCMRYNVDEVYYDGSYAVPEWIDPPYSNYHLIPIYLVDFTYVLRAHGRRTKYLDYFLKDVVNVTEHHMQIENGDL